MPDDVVSTLAGSVVFLFDESGTIALGTGFVLGYPTTPEARMVIPLIVTAKHVVNERNVVQARFSTQAGGTTGMVRYDLAAARRDGDCWTHDDEGVDIVVFRTLNYQQLKYHALPLTLVASQQTFIDEDIKATDRVIFPSMLANFMGTTKNYPVTRDGTIALIPEEPVPVTFTIGPREIKSSQPVILLDATSIPGASGSPVFLWPGSRLKANSIILGGGQAWLLGVMHGFYVAPRDVLKVQVTRTIDVFAENSRIAIVFPAWRIREILEQPVAAHRLTKLIADEPALPPAPAAPAEAPTI
jgi:hypothetical protein